MKNPLARLADRPGAGTDPSHHDDHEDLDLGPEPHLGPDAGPEPEPVVEHAPDDEDEPVDPDRVEVRRNGVLAAGLGAVAAVVALAYLVRAVGSGSAVDWVVFLAIGAIAVTQGLALRDARTPLLVADRTGIRLRLGRSWQGLPWDQLEEVEHAPRHTVLRDGRLVAFPIDTEAVLAGLDPMARRQAAVAERVHGAPFAVPLGFTTKVVGADGGLTAALTRLAPDPELVVEVVPEETQHVEEPVEPEAADPSADWSDAAAEDLTDTAERTRPVVVLTRDADVAQAAQVEDTQETVVRPVEATSTPSALRSPISAIRSEVTSRLSREPAPAPDDTGVWRSETVLVPEMDLPTRTPVIGPQLAEARQALGLDVERLAQRTRIRPHVIEAIERDDFESCGGDFYARGHLRTLARVLGVDATPLLATYDDTYADAPIDPRRVFEAELATGTDGPIRSLRGGANWSVVVAAVMAVVLAWSVARLVVDRPEDTAADTPGLSAGSAGLTSGETALAPAVPVLLTAEGGGAKVVVRDGAGTVVFKGNLAFGQSKTVKASPPVRVQTSDGSLTVGLDGADPTSMGRTGKAARNTFVPPVD